MNTRDRVNTITSLDQSQNQNVTWGLIEQPDTPPRNNQPRGRGEIPYQLEIQNNYHPRRRSGRAHSNNTDRMANANRHDLDEPCSQYQFSQIVSNVREASGGWNTFSNDVIERRLRERRQKAAKESNEKNNSDTCNATSSTESSASYKTTLQDSYHSNTYRELVTSSEEVTSEIPIKSDLDRYKKNALMYGLLNKVEDSDVERQSTNESSEDYYETTSSLNDVASSLNDVVSGVANLNTEETQMQNDRIGRFFQSQEDEDVYCHPLKEQIQKDPDWQKFRLKRKGTETVLSSRQLYLDLDDEQFTFESRRSN